MSDWSVLRGFEMDACSVISSKNVFMCGGSFSNDGSTAWPLANQAILVPFRVGRPVTICKLGVATGTTPAGNFDLGIYDEGGNRLVSSGAQAKQASALQVIDIADLLIGPGRYYLAMAADGTNNYFMTNYPLTTPRMMGVQAASSAYPLPASITWGGVLAGTLVPAVCAYLRPE